MTVARAALVTGGSSGIGLALASVLAAEGHDVTIAARDPGRLEEARARIQRGTARDIHAVAADVTEPESIRALVESHVDRFGRLDVLCLSAGYGRPTDLEAIRPDDVGRMLAVNVAAPLDVLRESMPWLRKAADEHGRALVVLVASIAGATPTPGFAVYSATKAAVRSLARSLNDDLAESGIRACALCPGFVDTPMTGWVTDDDVRASMIDPADLGEVARLLLRLGPNSVVDEVVIRRPGSRYGEP
ncbi:MAG: 3-oxoacyl-[acyl-carrier protein] reductase [Actinomycetota bacterium]|jgi:NAD(P)-dependent dehydrogenase (short-subunit alcohol dehydrogenase family)|nr:3-oxoacyl-[acyl-carrier protein] reductase [Actinomycetota bacterium]